MSKLLEILKSAIQEVKQPTFEDLEKLETLIQQAAYKTSKYGLLSTQKGIKYKERWNKMMKELRGWDEYGPNNQTKQSWLDYCERTNKSPNYTFGDVMA